MFFKNAVNIDEWKYLKIIILMTTFVSLARSNRNIGKKIQSVYNLVFSWRLKDSAGTIWMDRDVAEVDRHNKFYFWKRVPPRALEELLAQKIKTLLNTAILIL